MRQREMVLYTRGRSLRCWRAGRFLERAGYDFEVVDTTDDPRLLAEWDSMYVVSDRDHALEAHNRIEVSVKDTEGPRKSKLWAAPFVGRQATWSPGGEWCVVAGSLNVVFVLRRWGR